MTNEGTTVTICICNFNTRKLLANALRTFNIVHQKSKYNFQFVIVDNSNKEKCFNQSDIPDDFRYDVQIVDNTKEQVFKYVNGHADYKHSKNVQYAMDMCNTKKFVLCDSDIFFIKPIDQLIDDCKLVSSGIRKNSDPRGQRFLPFLQVFDLEKLRKYQLRFLDDDFNQSNYKYKFLLGHGTNVFTGVILTYQILEKYSDEFINVQINNYIRHLSHGNSASAATVDEFIGQADDLIEQTSSTYNAQRQQDN